MKITRKELRQMIKEEVNSLSPKSGVVTLELGNKKIYVEVADNPASRNQGLMFRTILGKDCGMLFAYPRSQKLSFWMKNTPMPLSIAFINEAGVITNIESMKPHDLSNTSSSGAALYALEMRQDWFNKHNISVGDVITGLPPRSSH
tara:strand:+ start:134 stop:571 length:438 start_codon:yes stop_codon:yes gene_type:complete